MSEDERTRRPGRMNLLPLKFEDALRSMPTTMPTNKSILRAAGREKAARSGSPHASQE